MLVELRPMEQRYQAGLEVLNGATVIEVARRYGVVRLTVHGWLRRYARDGLTGLADRSSKPWSCPHQSPAEIEARIVELRRAHPAWGLHGHDVAHVVVDGQMTVENGELIKVDERALVEEARDVIGSFHDGPGSPIDRSSHDHFGSPPRPTNCPWLRSSHGDELIDALVIDGSRGGGGA